MGAFDDAISEIKGKSAPFDAAIAEIKSAKKEKPYTYSVLPVSEDEQGRPHFDSNAGILGAIKRAVTLPGDVYTGKVDPNSPEGTKRAVEFATTFSPVNPAIRAGERAIPGALRAEKPSKVTPPTAEELKAAADEGYTKARSLGVDYAAPAIVQLAGGIKSGLENEGILAELAPGTHSILSKLGEPPAGAVAPYVGLEAARRAFRHVAGNFNNPTDQLAAKRAIDHLDEFLARPPEESVVAGPAADLGKIAEDARANYAAAKRSEKLNDLETRVERRAASANSGLNVDNTLRQRAASILEDPKKRAGFSKEELDALERVSRGDRSRNAARWVGNILGGGGGLGAIVTSGIGGAGGASIGGPLGGALGAAAPPTVGLAAKLFANRKAMQALESVDEMTRSRSPLFTRMQEEAPMEAVSPEGRALLTRALGLDALTPGHQRAMSELAGEPVDDRRRKKKGRK